MSTRQFGLGRPRYRRAVRGQDAHPAALVVPVVSQHLKARPMDFIELTEDEAIALASDLLLAVRNKREHP